MDSEDGMSGSESGQQPSSAGRETIPLTVPPAQPERWLLLGWFSLPVLMVSVALLLVWRFPQVDLEGMAILMTIGGTLLFFAFWRHVYGLMIPGLILICLSFGVALAQLTAGEAVLWSLSAAFVLIALAGRSLFGERHNWPLVVAGIIGTVALMIWLTGLASQMAYVLLVVPLLLVVAGLYLGFWRRQAS